MQWFTAKEQTDKLTLHRKLTIEQNQDSINVREYRRANQKWTIKRNWQHRVHKTKKKKHATKYVLDTTIRNQTQIT